MHRIVEDKATCALHAWCSEVVLHVLHAHMRHGHPRAHGLGDTRERETRCGEQCQVRSAPRWLRPPRDERLERAAFGVGHAGRRVELHLRHLSPDCRALLLRSADVHLDSYSTILDVAAPLDPLYQVADDYKMEQLPPPPPPTLRID